jgi:hypothetical protein
MKIQKELDETKIVLHKTIESVLQRGEKIDDLVAKSDGLSAQSKMFYSRYPCLGKLCWYANIGFSTSEEAEFLLCGHVDVLGNMCIGVCGGALVAGSAWHDFRLASDGDVYDADNAQ